MLLPLKVHNIYFIAYLVQDRVLRPSLLRLPLLDSTSCRLWAAREPPPGEEGRRGPNGPVRVPSRYQGQRADLHPLFSQRDRPRQLIFVLRDHAGGRAQEERT